jgi:tRNA threonylcarbamoyl adenosine modification protein (Sua5/YciO/YrdC/YwlC family)
MNRCQGTARHKRALLFDLDGTLIRAGGAGQRAFERAWAAVFRIPHPFDDEPFAGRTDPSIFATAATRVLGRPPTGDETDAFLTRYLEILPDALDRNAGFRVLPGIDRLVRSLANRPDCLVGLCTGNLEPGARIKLERTGLNPCFRFGGFATDDPDRPALTRVAIERARARAGGPIEPMIIGDSIHDASAARANGAILTLVATGVTPIEELAACEPDLLFDSFADWQTVLARMLGLGTSLRADVGDVERAADVVRNGGVLAYPTATLYGLGGDGLSSEVADRIRCLKGGREAPFLVLTQDTDSALELASFVSPAARELAARFWPGPLTLVLPGGDALPRSLLGPGGTVAVRVDPHPFPRALAATCGRPILSTSANLSGTPPPARAQDVSDEIIGGVDLFVTETESLAGLPSTLVRVENDGRLEILRHGAIPESEILA